jgi:uncharacterized protein YbjT (DUF2867 family)
LKKVIVAGASGLIGGELVHLLLNNNNIDEVTALVRKPINISSSKLKQIIIDFDKLHEYKNLITGDAIYCCLGTTKSKTPDRADYRKIDHDYPEMLAKISAENKIKQFHFVSALGADSKSTVFYSRLKGETEADISGYSFQSIHIYRPSLLLGERKENRTFEKTGAKIMKVLNLFLVGNLKKYRSIKAEVVAKTMIKQTMKDLEGIYIYPSDKINELE